MKQKRKESSKEAVVSHRPVVKDESSYELWNHLGNRASSKLTSYGQNIAVTFIQAQCSTALGTSKKRMW